MLYPPFYDPTKTYEENYEHGPFGAFADLSPEALAKGDGKVFSDKGEPRFEFLGVKVHSLFGIPAGPLVNGRFVKAALDKGFDLPVYKTVRSGQYPCHQWPNVLSVKAEGDITLEKAGQGLTADENYEEPLSITNSFGVPSQNPDVWQPDLAQTIKYARQGQAVIGSFQGTATGGDEKKYIDDFALTAKLVKETGCGILEVNLSCPNEGSAHLLCFDIARVRKVAEAIKNEIGNTPLAIKIAYFKDNKQLEELVKTVGNIVDSIAAINTIPAKIYNQDGQQALSGANRLVSGTCGAGIKWAGLEMNKRLKDLREQMGLKFTIVGVGGVMSPADYQEYKSAGADAVMSATGAMWNPYLAREIKQSLITSTKY